MNVSPINPNIALNERRRAQRQIMAETDRLSPAYRERDFGIGYGTSSGYVRIRSYTAAASRPLFRVA